VQPSKKGIGVATSLGRHAAMSTLAVLAESCMLATPPRRACGRSCRSPTVPSRADYLRKVPGVRGGVLVDGDRIGVAGGVEIAA
jgi:hypothetical protein